MLTVLEHHKLRFYQRRFPNIKSAEQALEAAVNFDAMVQRKKTVGVFIQQDRESLLNMAELLEKEGK